ncbi:protein-disulfide reductase DsbD [Thalassolituus oleivorans]|jgi:thiol:disulfide interchange protein DsbD|uniref:Thiol:disulfide interchange protein DsbD n=2 Tax=root TaxID=1 RepID=M5E753_9GAMM|nr:protein-disulfide reductase DsbD [Thalassolituus oleivorans]CCU73285.1 Thiol:disulfide interchange protein dsbD 1 precursor (Protein-disulfide reductase 1) (Disulfide reductase 1) [Thalassolituus oleivorans MIL-1]
MKLKSGSSRIKRWGWHLLAVLCLAMTSSLGHAGLLDAFTDKNADAEFLPVGQAFPLSSSSSNGKVTAEWRNADGYYLYKHRIYLQQGDIKLEPDSYSQAGKAKQDEAFGEVIAFYHDLEVTFDTQSLNAGTAILHYQGCADAGLCYPPQRENVEVIAPQSVAQQAITTSTIQPAMPTEPNTDSWFSGRSWGAVVGIFFILGLGLTFTPCVLPMVPILTSVVLGQGNTSGKRGFLLSSTYVLGMALTYAAAGLTVGLLGAGANVQAWMQTPWVLIVFAGLFSLLALAMFGVYELQLPSGIRNRLNNLNQGQQGGRWLSVFVMGILSALVVSPCVSAPLAGALVYLSTTGDALLGGSALLALGLGMGAPLIVLGTTGASVLPKAGAWMNQIKALFGILLLGVAIWLLGRILPATWVLLLWGLLALVYGISLGALEQANNGSQRVIKGFALVLVLYGACALIGALQGNDDPLQPLASQYKSAQSVAEQAATHAPFTRLTSVTELERIIASEARPVMVDFYADWCISCKVMEKEVFEQADVIQALSHIRWVQLDVTDQTAEHIAFMQQHAVFGPPSMLFFSAGSEQSNARLIGEATKSEFTQHVLMHLPKSQ